jgi:hypothetical protein
MLLAIFLLLTPFVRRFVDFHAGYEERQLTGERIVIATGTRPAHPSEVEFDDRTILDSDGLLLLDGDFDADDFDDDDELRRLARCRGITLAGPRLDHHLEALVGQRADHVRNQRHAALLLSGLVRYAYLHLTTASSLTEGPGNPGASGDRPVSNAVTTGWVDAFVYAK